MPRGCVLPMLSATSTEVMTIVSENGNEFPSGQERVPVYQLEGVSKTYALGGGQVHAVRELGLTIESGDARNAAAAHFVLLSARKRHGLAVFMRSSAVCLRT